MSLVRRCAWRMNGSVVLTPLRDMDDVRDALPSPSPVGKREGEANIEVKVLLLQGNSYDPSREHRRIARQC